MPAPCARAACAPLPCPAMASFPHPTDMPLWYRKSWCEPSCRLYFFARRQRGFALVGRQLFALPFVCFAQCSPRLLYFLPAACYTAGKLTEFLAGRRCSLVRFAETTFAPQGDGRLASLQLRLQTNNFLHRNQKAGRRFPVEESAVRLFCSFVCLFHGNAPVCTLFI